jgi:hypothetical protein
MRIIAVIGITVMIFGAMDTVMAQQERDVIEVMKSQIATQRQALVAENLQLTAEESDVFWPVYRKYMAERDELVDRRVDVLKEFRDNFDGLGDDQAKTLLDDFMQLQGDILRVQKKYVGKFRRVLTEKKTLRYFQIENKMDAIIDYDLAQVVPLAE